MRILITEVIWEEGIQALERAGISVDYDQELGRNRAELLSVISNYDGLIVRNETKVDSEMLEKGDKLKVVGRLGVGLDNIDLHIARKKDIKVVAAKHANATSVAEYVLAAMMHAYRKISDATIDIRKGNWSRKQFTGLELSGKTLGLLGLGEIAHRVANRAKIFGMNITGYDPFITPYDHILTETGVKRVDSLEELIMDADFISIHVPLTDETKNIFNRETFTRMKSNSYIINTARGGIINELDLCDAVRTNEIAGAYLDVLETEPIQANSPLFDIDTIQLTPHVAGLTHESQTRTSLLVAQEVVNVLKGKTSLCSV